MPAGNHGATSSSAAPSLLASLNKMQWDAVLAVVMASDPYYHYETPSTASAAAENTTTPSSNAKEKSDADANTATAPESSQPQKMHWFRKYLISSSKTRLLIHACSIGYLGYVLTHPSRYVPCHVTVAQAASTSSAAVPSTDCFLYQSAEGMQLLMNGPMPRWTVLAHAAAGTLLLPLAVTQKESAFYMQFSKRHVVQTTTTVEASTNNSSNKTQTRSTVEEVHRGDAQAQKEHKKVQLRRARVSRHHHANTGGMTVACVTIMVAGGVSLRSYSVFSPSAISARAGLMNFATAMFVFAAPWAVLAPCTAASGKNAKAVVHAMFGGILVKAVMAVPFERVLCGLWQRAAGVRVALPSRKSWFAREEKAAVPVAVTQQVEGELERVYYKSILATTVIFGVWGLVDIVRFVSLARACVVTNEQAKKRE